MKQIKLVFVAVLLCATVFTTSCAEKSGDGKKTGEMTVDTFARDAGITHKKGTPQYEAFMKEILLGEHLELTKIGSKYVSNQADLDLVLEYATGQMSPLLKNYPVEEELKEVKP